MEFLTPLLGNIGTVSLLILVWKSGLLKYLMEAKNGNGKNDKVDLLVQHFNHELTDSLNRIEKKLDKLDEIKEELIYIKVKIKNGE